MKKLLHSCGQIWDFSAKERRLIFRNDPESYNYKELNLRFNKENEVDTSKLEIVDYPYDLDNWLSANLVAALEGEAGLDKKTAQNYMFEMLDAMDQDLVDNIDIENTVDDLNEYLEQEEVVTFSIKDGYIVFKKVDGDEVLKLRVISSRQQDLRDSYYDAVAEAREEAETEVDRLAREFEEKKAEEEIAEAERQARIVRWREKDRLMTAVSKEAMGQPYSMDSIRVELPKLSRRQFALSPDFWIRQKQVPQTLARRFRQRVVCMAHVGELITREIGSIDGAASLGYREGIDAWEFKNNVLKANGGEVLSDIGRDYLALSRGTIVERDTGSAQYKEDIAGLWDVLNYAQSQRDIDRLVDGRGKPVVMGLFYRGSAAKRKSASYNMRLDPEYRSLNTHVVYLLGRDYRELDGYINGGEYVSTYLARTLGVKYGFSYLLGNGNVRVNDVDLFYSNGQFVDADGEIVVLKYRDRVEWQDFWFSHHFNGSKIDCLTHFLGSGKYVPDNVTQLDTSSLPKEDIAKIPSDERLKPKGAFNLLRKKSVYESFVAAGFDLDSDAWKYCKYYWDVIGFDTSSITEIEPIPVPDVKLFKEYLEEQGGWSTIKNEELRRRYEIFNKSHKSEQLITIEFGMQPWDLVSDYFSNMDPPLNEDEKKYVLEEIDNINATIDLRLYDRFHTENDGLQRTLKDYMRWHVGSYIWVSDELMKSLANNISYKRISESVHVPSQVTLFGEKVDITQGEIDMINDTTDDPLMRMLLLLSLVNEQKGGSLRGAVVEFADKIGIYKEKGIGLFQLRVTKEDMEYINETYGYEFVDFTHFKEMIAMNARLNAKVALRRMEIAANGYAGMLRANGENPDIHDRHFVSGVLTCYNRNPAYMYSGLFGTMAQDLSDTFDLGLSYSEYEKDMSGGEGFLSKAYDFYRYGFDAFKDKSEYVERIKGVDQKGIAQFWVDVSSSLVDSGEVVLTEEQILDDLKLLQESSSQEWFVSAEQQGVKAVPYLIVFNKPKFLCTNLYKAVNSAYKQKSGNSLSLLISDEWARKSDVEDYGYGVVKDGQVEDILSYSTDINDKMLADRDMEEINLYELSSVVSKRGYKT